MKNQTEKTALQIDLESNKAGYIRTLGLIDNYYTGEQDNIQKDPIVAASFAADHITNIMGTCVNLSADIDGRIMSLYYKLKNEQTPPADDPNNKFVRFFEVFDDIIPNLMDLKALFNEACGLMEAFHDINEGVQK